jgi:general secretion pathway protein G
MLASARSARSNTRRAAFTLVEVLVVVAIVVILASVGTLATFKFLEDAKVDAARSKAENLLTYAKTWSTRNDNAELQDIAVLANYADDGLRATMDPWDKQYRFMYIQDQNAPYPRLFIYTEAMVDGQQRMVGAPKDLEAQANGQ